MSAECSSSIIFTKLCHSASRVFLVIIISINFWLLWWHFFFLNFTPFPVPLLYTGDILALSINHLDSLVELPVGCGEQNMVLFAPSIYVLQYLDRSNQDNAEIRSRALGYMKEGVQ